MLLLFVLKGHFLLLMHRAFRIIAVPIPAIIPPYIQPKNLSSVSGLNFSNISRNNDNNTVPAMAFIKKCFPFLKNDIINNGIFSASTIVPNWNF